MQKIIIIFTGIFLSACAQLHHAQIGDVYSPTGYVQKPFEIKMSESGVDIGEATKIAGIFASDSRNEEMQRIAALIAMFQMGPRTGNPVYVKGYADKLIQVIYEKCPSGQVTGLMSVRETRKYPVISGEIVKVTGYCLIKRGA